MAKENSPSPKKKYEPPSIASPGSGIDGKADFVPLGATGCQSGSIGSTCANGTQPKGGPTKCQSGSQPTVLNCNTGTTANDNCINGTDALAGCGTGTAVMGDCMNGVTPQGPNCYRGSTASVCGRGTGPG